MILEQFGENKTEYKNVLNYEVSLLESNSGYRK